MGATTFSTDFFSRDAAHNLPRDLNADRMEKAVIACQKKDAVIIRRALQKLAGWLTKDEGNESDGLENAILACQRRDRAAIGNLLKGH